MNMNFNVKEWNKAQRKSAVCAMEYLARQINDEEIFMLWLANGVADGDIPYNCFDEEMVDDSYIEPDNFAELMHEFLRLMHLAYKEDSGLYCGDVVSK